jgi:AraC family transcriptional regulator
MFPRFEIMKQKLMVGMSSAMSLSVNTTRSLWQAFMPRRFEVLNRMGNDYFSIEICPSGYFSSFYPTVSFEKWAAVEVSACDSVPVGMKSILNPAGLYAVFNCKGSSDDAFSAYQVIHGTWLPSSGYRLDNRPHFSVMDE